MLREINQQITKLESQAQTAKKHNDFQEKLKLTFAQIQLLKKRIANTAWEASKEVVAEITIKLDQKKSRANQHRGSRRKHKTRICSGVGCN